MVAQVTLAEEWILSLLEYSLCSGEGSSIVTLVSAANAAADFGKSTFSSVKPVVGRLAEAEIDRSKAALSGLEM